MIDLLAEAAALPETWSPRVLARINDSYLKVARIEGEFVWHEHRDEDEMFLVLKGELRIEREGDATVHLKAGQAFVVPRGVRHRPIAAHECLMALFEPVGTAHTGEERTALTRTIEEQLGTAPR